MAIAAIRWSWRAEALIRETLPSTATCRSPSSITTNENCDVPGGKGGAVALFSARQGVEEPLLVATQLAVALAGGPDSSEGAGLDSVEGAAAVTTSIRTR